jgi:hypothetical protein
MPFPRAPLPALLQAQGALPGQAACGTSIQDSRSCSPVDRIRDPEWGTRIKSPCQAGLII